MLRACEAPSGRGSDQRRATGGRISLNELLRGDEQDLRHERGADLPEPRAGDVSDSQADISKAQDAARATNRSSLSRKAFAGRSNGAAPKALRQPASNGAVSGVPPDYSIAAKPIGTRAKSLPFQLMTTGCVRWPTL